MGRIPEQGDGLGKDKTILDVPVDFLRKCLSDFQLVTKETTQRATRLGNMDVGDFVEGHKDRGKEGVHQYADAQSHKGLAPTEVACKPVGGLPV